jgi:2-methylcitrate dehydratase PrpD
MSDVAAAPSSSSLLAAFVANLTYGELPTAMVDLAIEAIAEVLRGAAGGWEDEALQQLFDVVAPLNSSPEASVVGRRTRLGAGYAALLNAAAAQVTLEGSARSVDRQVADVVAAAAVAVAEFSKAEPPDLLVGVVAGLEAAARIALALGPSHAERGWRVAGTAGRVGAAVAASRTLRRSPEDHLAAIAFAATQAAGFAIGSGVSVPALVAGRAANDGVEAAVVAAVGLIGDPLPLEGRRGLLALVSDGADATELAAELGTVWRAEAASANDGSPKGDALYGAALHLSDSGDLASVLAEAELLAEH